MSFDSRFDAHIAAPNPPTNNKLLEQAGNAMMQAGNSMVSRDSASSMLPPLDIVPTDVAGYLRSGQKLNVPQQSGWADGPSNGFTPADQGPVRGGIAGPGSETSKHAPSPTDKAAPGPADTTKKGHGDVCKTDSNLREKVIANGKSLSHEELTGALNILDALKRGDDKAVEKELNAFKDNPAGMKHMADALRPALAAAGIDVNYQHIDDIRTGKTTAYLHLYHHGAPHDLEIAPGGADAGDAFTRGGQTYFEGPARFGKEIMSSVMKDLQDALNKNQCKVSK